VVTDEDASSSFINRNIIIIRQVCKRVEFERAGFASSSAYKSWSRARETLRAEKSISNSAHYYSSWLMSQCIYVDLVWHLYLVYLQTVNSVYLQKWYMSWYKIGISTNYIFNKIFAALIWMDGPTKKLLHQINEPSHERVWEIIKPLRWWDGEMTRNNEREIIGLKFNRKNI
jgi:hypothetical protein